MISRSAFTLIIMNNDLNSDFHSSDSAFAMAKMMAKNFGADIVVTHVVEPRSILQLLFDMTPYMESLRINYQSAKRAAKAYERKLEKEGIKESKKLLKSTKGYYEGLFTLMVTTMIHDSEKHVEILDFLRRRLKKA